MADVATPEEGKKGFVTNDNISAKHPIHIARAAQWKKCSDCYEGEDSIKAAGVAYLPKLTKQEQADYDAYKSRASFYAAMSRTVEGLLGIMFRKDPSFPEGGLNEKAIDWLSAVGVERESFNSFVEGCGRNLLVTGFGGVLVDYPSKATAGTMPYWARYNETSILNWRTDTVNDKPDQLVMLVLEEPREELKDGSSFEYETNIYYRVLELVEFEPGSIRCRVRLFTEIKESTSVNKTTGSTKSFRLAEDEVYVVVDGRNLDFIPFAFITTNGNTTKVTKPPMVDIANVNLSHYRNSADLEHGRHFTALPTPWAAGFKSDEGSLYIGSSKAWVTENENAHCGFLEYTGQGLSALEKALDSKESQMAVLGARMLEEPKKVVEAADTHRIRNLGEQSVTANLVNSLEETVQYLLGITHRMVSLGTSEPKVSMNKDFEPGEISPQLLTVLFQGLQEGTISYPTLFYNMKKGELIPEGIDMEKELDLVQKYANKLLALQGSMNLDNQPGGTSTDAGIQPQGGNQ